MYNDEACFMHLTPGVVNNFPKNVGVCLLCTNYPRISSLMSTINGSVLPQDEVGDQLSELNVKCLVRY